jgi:hypothetical protein
VLSRQSHVAGGTNLINDHLYLATITVMTVDNEAVRFAKLAQNRADQKIA